MHLLLLGPDWKITARFRREMITDMLAAGWAVTIAAGGDKGEDVAFLESIGAVCVPLSSERAAISPVADIRLTLEVMSLCRRIRPDAVLAFTVKPATFGLIGAALGGVPVRAAMITGLGYALMAGGEVKRRVIRAFVSILYKISIGNAHMVFFQNPDDLEDFVRWKFSHPRLKVVRINGSGVDLAHYSLHPLPQSPLTFVMVARLLKEKGVYEYVEAARLVKDAHPAVNFVLVGPLDPNPTAISAEELVGWTASDTIEYFGEQTDVRPFLRRGHVFVLPSYREGTPRSALEALATGRAVLTTDVPGCREVVKDGLTGRIVGVRSSKALAEGMEWFIENADRLPALSREARLDAEQRFDVHIVNQTIMASLAGERI